MTEEEKLEIVINNYRARIEQIEQDIADIMTVNPGCSRRLKQLRDEKSSIHLQIEQLLGRNP